MNGISQWKLEPSLDSLVVQGIDFIWRQEYGLADSLFSKVIEQYPHHPAGYLYKATVMQAYTIDYDVPVHREKFDSLLDCGRNTTSHIPSPWREYFRGSADGCEAYERVESGSWLSGVQKGLASTSEYEEIVEKDSTFYDAYIGIGTYYYWSSRKTMFIRWLPFVKDNRELGIQMLILGAEHSVYNRCAAISALISIYLDVKDYKHVEMWSQRGLKMYPHNRIFLWGLATALDNQKMFHRAVNVYTDLLENILQAHSPHPYGEIVCRLNLAKAMISIGDTTTSQAHMNKILSYEKSAFPNTMKPRAQGKFEETRVLLSSINNKHAEAK
jgi:tetratricopeptide (TPR) repeat protein